MGMSQARDSVCSTITDSCNWCVYTHSIVCTKYLVHTQTAARLLEFLNVKVGVSILLIFASIPDCSQNQTTVSYTLHLLSDS
jgi:hypothetical protein